MESIGAVACLVVAVVVIELGYVYVANVCPWYEVGKPFASRITRATLA